MRLFVALELPGPARAALAAWADAAAPPEVRRVPAGDLHLTLAFLGERPGVDADAVAAVLPGLARPLGELRTAGALWLPPRRPGVLAVALAGDADLSALQADLVAALAATIDWTAEARAFRPHVTVGRVRRGTRVETGGLQPPPDLGLAAQALTLYRSTTAPGGARYEAVAQAPLV
jgi:2'-5' RNA ligase